MKVLLQALAVSLLAACAGSGPAVTEPVPVAASQPEWPAPVGEVPLQPAPPGAGPDRLDVGLVIFDPGIPEDVSTHSELGIFPRIREAEARFMPVVLRKVLIASDAWGVVRVLPEAEPASEILVTGRILHSDGLRLALRVRAADATGRQWLDQVYLDEAGAPDYPVAEDSDPYIDLYRRIANDLLEVHTQLSAREREAIRRVGLLRYAAGLSPEAFDNYLVNSEEGRWSLARLPAEGDPMMGRVQRIRNQEHLFIDTVDEQYADLHATMAPTYNLWRQYGREQAIYRKEYQERVANRDSQGRRGTFFAMQRTYDAYKWSKIQEQDLDEMAAGFNNEVAPTIMQASGKVFRLNGTLDSQYRDWREILRAIFALETGLESGSGPAGPPSVDAN